MAVRFLPPPEERVPANRDEGENLAEVVEMRSWLRPTSVDEGIAEDADATDVGAEADATVGGAATEPVAQPLGEVEEHSSESLGIARVTQVRFGAAPEVTGDAVESESESESETVTAGTEPAADPLAGSAAGAAVGATEQEPGRSEAYEDAVRLLARRARSSGELRDDLLALDHSADNVSIVIDEFIESHYLDDVGLARVQSEKLRESKGASRGQISRKLRERKLPDAVVEEILGELDVDEEYSLLREAAAKRAERLSGLDRQTAQRRLLGFLARRGWSGEPAVRAANEALDGARRRGGRSSGGVRFE